MFFKIYKFKKYAYTSSARRNSYFFYNALYAFRKFKHLSLKKKWLAGRDLKGRIIIRTKSSLLIKNKISKINYHLRYLQLGTIVSFQFIPFKNKLLSLIFFSNGAATYYITSEFHKLFSYIYFNYNKKFKKFKFQNYSLMLFQVKKLSFVSCLEALPGSGAQYCRSSGTKGKVIKFDKETHTVLVQLPSGLKKVFSFFSFVLVGKVALSLNSKCLNNKSGYWRSFGVKSIVRGVAKNPVDHPHGGRTKAIKYPRTPWGKTTKFK